MDNNDDDITISLDGYIHLKIVIVKNTAKSCKCGIATGIGGILAELLDEIIRDLFGKI